ncbi:hypothetical protein, partial [Lutibacter sp. HS1-25]|uniref:hypothetical protein n=1 Tax=Lutibacter sp. HS1-25 TaxID=2485000 RepID=UPI00197B89B1
MTVQNIRHFQLDWKSIGFVVQKMFFVHFFVCPKKPFGCAQDKLPKEALAHPGLFVKMFLKHFLTL